ncbi:hypothetical protein [Streptosporangium roseum]|uniref:hypothetical protein n=1 Tax=Streptosporangium roseum TaxID=2001 RepID=UPI00332D16D0
MNRDRSTFTACAEALPTDLRDRVQPMRDCALARRACPSCRQISDLVWLAFDAAFVGDQGATLRAVEQAELVASQHESGGCAGQQPRRKRISRRVPGFDRPGAGLVAATDAAHLGTCSGMGYVTSDGGGMQRRTGNGTQYLSDPTGPSKLLIAELRAAGDVTPDVPLIIRVSGLTNERP